MGINPSKFLKFSALLLDLDNLPDIFQFLLNLHLAYDLKGRFRAHKQKSHSKDLKTHYYVSSKQNNFSRLWMKNLFVTIQLYGNDSNSQIYYTHFEITGGPCNLIGCNWCDLFPNRTIFCFESHLFPSQRGGYTKNKTTDQISRLFESNQSIAGKWKTKSTMWQILQLLFPKLLFFPPKNWMNLISNRLSIASIKYFNWPSPVFGQFQNGCNWTLCRAILVWNHTCDFWRLSI